MRRRIHTTLRWAAVLVLGLMLFAAGVPALAQTAEEKSAGTWSEDRRYRDNGDQTITDTQTGLMWMKQDSYQRAGQWLTWMEAFEYIKQLNEQGFAGYFDWQLPGLDDLKTLYEKDKTNSKQVGHEMVIHIDPIFEKEGSGAWWSREPNGHFNAFGIEFNNGSRFSAPKKSLARKAVRAMRVAAPPSHP